MQRVIEAQPTVMPPSLTRTNLWPELFDVTVVEPLVMLDAGECEKLYRQLRDRIVDEHLEGTPWVQQLVVCD